MGSNSFEDGQISMIDKPSKFKVKKNPFEEKDFCIELQEEIN